MENERFCRCGMLLSKNAVKNIKSPKLLKKIPRRWALIRADFADSSQTNIKSRQLFKKIPRRLALIRADFADSSQTKIKSPITEIKLPISNHK